MCDPASKVVLRLAAALPGEGAAVAKLAAALHVARPTVWKWMQPKGRSGGTGGLIPQRYHRPVLDLAQSLAVPLNADDFLPLPDPPSILCPDGGLAPEAPAAGVLPGESI